MKKEMTKNHLKLFGRPDIVQNYYKQGLMLDSESELQSLLIHRADSQLF